MNTSSSIIQEYYKAVDYWAEIADRDDWKLAIWLIKPVEVDLVDKFFEVERSPIGQFEDIFFRFDSLYTGDEDEYAERLWQEYIGWFTEKTEEKYDILKALKQDGMLEGDYFPDSSGGHTASNLWKEMRRFKMCLRGLDDAYFCLYFPPLRPGEVLRTDWLEHVLEGGVPDGIRLSSVYYEEDKRIPGEASQVVVIHPTFNMEAALRHEMGQLDSSNDLIAPENRFKQQVTVVMDCTLKRDKKLMDRETMKLLNIAGELEDTSIRISSLFITSTAYYSIREYDASMKYIDKTLSAAEKAMEENDASGYNYWRMAQYMKAAILTTEKQREEAIAIYDRVAQEAIVQKDPYYVMESYRMSGFLRYEEGKFEKAFDCFLLSLSGGSYLSEEVRKNSTFTYSANLALHLGRQVRAPIDVEILEAQLQEWLGDGWHELVDGPNMEQAKARRRGSLFN